MKVQQINYVNQYASNKIQKSNDNLNFGNGKLAQDALELGTVFGEEMARDMAPYVRRWTDFLGKRGAKVIFERNGERLAIGVAGSEGVSRSGHAITSIHSWQDAVRALAKAANDFTRGNDSQAAYLRADRPISFPKQQ